MLLSISLIAMNCPELNAKHRAAMKGGVGLPGGEGEKKCCYQIGVGSPKGEDSKVRHDAGETPRCRAGCDGAPGSEGEKNGCLETLQEPQALKEKTSAASMAVLLLTNAQRY